MEYIIINSLIITNVILSYIIKELWKDNKKQKEIIRLQEQMLKNYDSKRTN